jgi:hypothetical protein
VLILYRRFGTTYRSHLQGARSPRPLKMGPIHCLETSVKDYKSTLANIPEECRSHQHRGGGLNLVVNFNTGLNECKAQSVLSSPSQREASACLSKQLFFL